MGEFDGKSVIVTGGALGIGGAASEAFAREGANVTILDWNIEAGATAVAQITSSGGTAQFVHGDAGTSEGCRSTVDAAVKSYGGERPVQQRWHSASRFLCRCGRSA